MQIADPANPGTYVTTLAVTGEGTWSVNGTSGEITFTPEANYNGPVTPITYQVADDDGATATATVSVTLTDVNDGPTVNDDSGTTAEDVAVTIDVVANDTDSDGAVVPASVVITTGASSQRGGTVVNNGNGTVTYTPRNVDGLTNYQMEEVMVPAGG